MVDEHCDSTVSFTISAAKPETLLLSSVSSNTDFETLATELAVEVDSKI